MGYPLVPGYESVGRVSWAGSSAEIRVGERVFVPGAHCYRDMRSVFGGSASRLVVSGRRVVRLDDTVGEQGVLIALAATAYHAIAGGSPPGLIVGHGVLGRLIARITIALDHAPPLVWEKDAKRSAGVTGYTVAEPDESHRGFAAIYDVSGDGKLLDSLIQRLAPQGEAVLAGFYAEPLTFAFPRAFMKEARIRVAAEWQAADLAAVTRLIDDGLLSLDGLISHRMPADEAGNAYRTAFGESSCLKMVLDWRNCS